MECFSFFCSISPSIFARDVGYNVVVRVLLLCAQEFSDCGNASSIVGSLVTSFEESLRPIVRLAHWHLQGFAPASLPIVAICVLPDELSNVLHIVDEPCSSVNGQTAEISASPSLCRAPSVHNCSYFKSALQWFMGMG